MYANCSVIHFILQNSNVEQKIKSGKKNDLDMKCIEGLGTKIYNRTNNMYDEEK